MKNGNFSEEVDGLTSWNVYSGTGSVSNGVLTVTGAVGRNGVKQSQKPDLVEGHKYYSTFRYTATVETQAYVISAPVLPITNVMTKYETVANYNGSAGNIDFFPRANGAEGDIQLADVYVIDLTTMFGSTIADYIYSLETATAGAGVAKLKEWGFFTEDYYEYSEPTLRSVEGLQSKKTVGWNQWDETTEKGYYDTITGEKESSNNWTCTKGFIPVLPNTDYYCKITVPSSGSFGAVLFYDGDKNLISFVSNSTRIANTVFTTPENARYMTMYSSSTWFQDGVCINLSDPTRNGQYEPYESHTYSLDSEVVLRGVPKLDSNNQLYFDGDIYPSDGNGSRKYALVDLGELNWVYDSSHQFFYHNNSGRKSNGSFVCDRYAFGGDKSDGQMDSVSTGVYSHGTYIYVKDTSFGTDATAFKTAMSGVYLLYELATPTTFTAQPYHNPQIVGDTEEFVTTGIVPVGHATRYYQNLRKKIEGLPWNFATLIAPTEVTNKATRNYTTGSYLILNNTLYKVTANIANGGTITPNTNCTATTIMAEFMSL